MTENINIENLSRGRLWKKNLMVHECLVCVNKVVMVLLRQDILWWKKRDRQKLYEIIEREIEVSTKINEIHSDELLVYKTLNIKS